MSHESMHESMPALIDDDASMPPRLSLSHSMTSMPPRLSFSRCITSMNSEVAPETLPEMDDMPPLPRLPLGRSFSNYNDPDTKMVEHWFYFGGTQPVDEAIQSGFPILYNQVYSEDIHGKPRWTATFHFTEEQQKRWEVMESIAGMTPIMNGYRQVHYEHLGAVAAYKERFN